MLSVDVPFPDSVDALEEALRRAPVLVQETRGSGDAAGAMDRISRLVARLPFAAYVAVIDAPPDVDAGIDSSRFLATALSRRIGEPGLYVVSASGSPTGIRIVGTDWRETLFILQSGTDGDAVETASGSLVLSPTVDVEAVLHTALAASPQTRGRRYRETSACPTTWSTELAERERDLQPYERPSLADRDEPPEPWSTGKRWMVGVSVGVGLLAVLLQSAPGLARLAAQARGRAARRRRSPQERVRAAGHRGGPRGGSHASSPSSPSGCRPPPPGSGTTVPRSPARPRSRCSAPTTCSTSSARWCWPGPGAASWRSRRAGPARRTASASSIRATTAPPGRRSGASATVPSRCRRAARAGRPSTRAGPRRR